MKKWNNSPEGNDDLPMAEDNLSSVTDDTMAVCGMDEIASLTADESFCKPEEMTEDPSGAAEETQMSLFPDDALGAFEPDTFEALPGENDADTFGHTFDDEPDALPETFDGDATVVPRPVRKRKSALKTILRVLAVLAKWAIGLVLVAAILVGGLVGYLTVSEYTPAYAENAQRGTVSSSETPSTMQSMRIVTFNTGYAGLGQDADFFMDGGVQVNPDSEQTVLKNMQGISDILTRTDADYIFLQEVDTDSDRTFHQNQWLQYEHELADYESRFALNYSCAYVPYPLNERIGEVHSGISTFSRYDISSATRYSLPCPFSWPTRVANLKRCLLVTRIPLGKNEGDPELVLVNFHLEAYDDGEGKREQTEQLLTLLDEEYAKGNYVVAGGDFNQTFIDALDRYPIKDAEQWQPGLLEALDFGWQYAYDISTPTCRLLNQPYSPSSEQTQYFVIDGFLVSPNVRIDRVETLNEGFVYSDHNPVVLEFTLLTTAATNAAAS